MSLDPQRGLYFIRCPIDQNPVPGTGYRVRSTLGNVAWNQQIQQRFEGPNTLPFGHLQCTIPSVVWIPYHPTTLVPSHIPLFALRMRCPSRRIWFVCNFYASLPAEVPARIMAVMGLQLVAHIGHKFSWCGRRGLCLLMVITICSVVKRPTHRGVVFNTVCEAKAYLFTQVALLHLLLIVIDKSVIKPSISSFI